MSASMKMHRFLKKANFRLLPSYFFHARNESTVSTIHEDKRIHYPPIKPKFPPGRWGSDIPPADAWKWHEKGEILLDLPDVRERLELMAGEKETWMCAVRPFDTVPKTLQYKQFITRSHIAKGFPAHFNNLTDEVDKKFDICKSVLQDTIVQESEYQYIRQLEKMTPTSNIRHKIIRSNRSLEKICNLLISLLASEQEYLLRSQMDQDTRLETFWLANGLQGEDKPAKGAWFGRLMMQYKAKMNFQIRTEQPLPEFVSMDDDLCTGAEVPEVDYSPAAINQQKLFEKPITMSGHWVGDPCEFALLSVMAPDWNFCKYARACEGALGTNAQAVLDEEILTTGLITSFASCVAQAHNQGFNMYFDLTYPLTSQLVISDGQWFQFFAYQLNTLQVWQGRDVNPYSNILWHTDKIKLYDTVESGKVKGFNDDVLRYLMRFVLNKPADRGVNLRPFLTESAPVNTELYISHKGDEPIEHPKKGRFQYPAKALYF